VICCLSILGSEQDLVVDAGAGPRLRRNHAPQTLSPERAVGVEAGATSRAGESTQGMGTLHHGPGKARRGSKRGTDRPRVQAYGRRSVSQFAEVSRCGGTGCWVSSTRRAGIKGVRVGTQPHKRRHAKLLSCLFYTPAAAFSGQRAMSTSLLSDLRLRRRPRRGSGAPQGGAEDRQSADMNAWPTHVAGAPAPRTRSNCSPHPGTAAHPDHLTHPQREPPVPARQRGRRKRPGGGRTRHESTASTRSETPSAR